MWNIPLLQCDCIDFEAMHKWAIKQFMRLVPHGRMLGQHLASKHYAQLLCTAPPPEEAAPTPRFCHCSMGPSQCTHSMHVHVAMPRHDRMLCQWMSDVGVTLLTPASFIQAYSTAIAPLGTGSV